MDLILHRLSNPIFSTTGIRNSLWPLVLLIFSTIYTHLSLPFHKNRCRWTATSFVPAPTYPKELLIILILLPIERMVMPAPEFSDRFVTYLLDGMSVFDVVEG